MTSRAMNDRQLKPAVPVETWEKIILFGDVHRYDESVGVDDDACTYLVALNNYALQPKHRSKITREHLDALKQLSGTSKAAAIDRLIDAIESILPPLHLPDQQ